MIEVPRLMTRFWNLLSRNSLASVVQWGGAPCCIHQYLFLVAIDHRAGPNRSCNNWRSQDPFSKTDLPFSSMKACTRGILPSTMAIGYKHHYLFIITIICFNDFMWVPSSRRTSTAWLNGSKTSQHATATTRQPSGEWRRTFWSQKVSALIVGTSSPCWNRSSGLFLCFL